VYALNTGPFMMCNSPGFFIGVSLGRARILQEDGPNREPNAYSSSASARLSCGKSLAAARAMSTLPRSSAL
jgi:hypothetical protein